MRIMPVDRVDCSWGVIDSNDFDLFTRCVRKLFREERFHLLGMRCVYCSVEKLMHQRPNPIHFFFQCEMACVEKMELCVGKLSFNPRSPHGRTRMIVFPLVRSVPVSYTHLRAHETPEHL